MEEARHANRSLVVKPLGKLKTRKYDGIKIKLRETGCEDRRWMGLT
jgi:hypothetical protein